MQREDKFKLLLTIAFVMFLVIELFFAYTFFSQIALFLFVGLNFVTLPKVYKNSFVGSYILFTILSIIIILFGFAIDYDVASKMTVTLGINCLFLFAFTQYCGVMGNAVTILKIYKSICIFASCIFLIFGLSSVLSGERLSVLGINANSIGMFAAYSMIVIIYEFYEQRQCDYRDVLVLILFSLVILLSASRKALLIPLIGWYVMLCLRQPKKLVKITGFVILCATSAIFLMLYVEPLYGIIGYRIEELLLFLNGIEEAGGSLDVRMHFIEYAWNNSKDSLLFGHGMDCFRTLPKAYGTYSHNNYMELLFSSGFLGILIYYSTSFITLLRGPKALNHRKSETSLLLAMLIPFLICDFMNVTYFTRRMLIIPSIAIMFLWRYSNEE